VVRAAQEAVRETGSAVALCSATTVIGYGSLVVADSQALAGFGALAAVGELTCLASALFVLPAFLCRKGEPKGERAPGLRRSALVAAPESPGEPQLTSGSRRGASPASG
jgi:predicted RND superfamily exporter protein